MKIVHNILGSIQVFVSINAIIASILFLIDTSGSKMGLNTEILSRTPFTDFLIPALILLVVNGFGSLYSAILAFKQNRFAGIAGIFMGLILCSWIHVQMIWLPYAWLQTAIYVFGCISVLLGMIIIDKTGIFLIIYHNRKSNSK